MTTLVSRTAATDAAGARESAASTRMYAPNVARARRRSPAARSRSATAGRPRRASVSTRKAPRAGSSRAPGRRPATRTRSRACRSACTRRCTRRSRARGRGRSLAHGRRCRGRAARRPRPGVRRRPLPPMPRRPGRRRPRAGRARAPSRGRSDRRTTARRGRTRPRAARSTELEERGDDEERARPRRSASQARAATGANATTPATSATAVAASMSGARARMRFQNAWRKAAPSASASAEVGIPRAIQPGACGMGHDPRGLSTALHARGRAIEELAERTVRPARDRWRDHRRGDRGTRCASGSRGRPRRRRRLRRRDLERVVEARPRRAPLPAPRRCAPRAGGASRAAGPDGCRRTASRASPPVSPAALRERVRTGLHSSRAASSCTRRSPTRGSTGSCSRSELASSCLRCASTGFARARCTQTPRRTTRGSASRTCERPRDAGACVLNGARGRRAPTSSGRVCGADVRVDGEEIAVDGARGRERGGPVGRPRAPARGPGRRDLGAAEQGRARPRPGGRGVGSGAHDRPGRRTRHVRGSVVGNAPARDDGRRVRRRSGATSPSSPADTERILADAAVALDYRRCVAPRPRARGVRGSAGAARR